jgi:hypothetical protein
MRIQQISLFHIFQSHSNNNSGSMTGNGSGVNASRSQLEVTRLAIENSACTSGTHSWVNAPFLATACSSFFQQCAHLRPAHDSRINFLRDYVFGEHIWNDCIHKCIQFFQQSRDMMESLLQHWYNHNGYPYIEAQYQERMLGISGQAVQVDAVGNLLAQVILPFQTELRAQQLQWREGDGYVFPNGTRWLESQTVLQLQQFCGQAALSRRRRTESLFRSYERARLFV